MDIYSALFGASFITLIVLFGIAIVTLVGKWKVYAKLGMPGWYSLIPVFSDYKLCERVRGGEENKTFLMAYLIVLICSWVLCWAPAVNWILIIAQFVMNIIVLNDLAHTFGKESAYTIGLVLLGIVFWPMLGFGESVPVDTEDDSDTSYEVALAEIRKRLRISLNRMLDMHLTVSGSKGATVSTAIAPFAVFS